MDLSEIDWFIGQKLRAEACIARVTVISDGHDSSDVDWLDPLQALHFTALDSFHLNHSQYNNGLKNALNKLRYILN